MTVRIAIGVLLLFLSSTLAAARPPELRLPSFTHLQGKAVQAVDVTLGPLPLRLMSWLMDEDDPESAAAKRTLQGISMIRVRSYEFAGDYEYSEKDIEGVRNQLRGEGWRKLVQVRDRKENEQVDVFLAMAGDVPGGMAIVASCPREFLIIHIIGTVDLENLALLQEPLGLKDERLARLHQLDH